MSEDREGHGTAAAHLDRKQSDDIAGLRLRGRLDLFPAAKTTRRVYSSRVFSVTCGFINERRRA